MEWYTYVTVVYIYIHRNKDSRHLSSNLSPFPNKSNWKLPPQKNNQRTADFFPEIHEFPISGHVWCSLIFFHPQLWFQPPQHLGRPSGGNFAPYLGLGWQNPHRKISGAIFSVPYTMWDVTRKHVFFWSNDSLPQLEHHGNFFKVGYVIDKSRKGFFLPRKDEDTSATRELKFILSNLSPSNNPSYTGIPNISKHRPNPPIYHH